MLAGERLQTSGCLESRDLGFPKSRSAYLSLKLYARMSLSCSASMSMPVFAGARDMLVFTSLQDVLRSPRSSPGLLQPDYMHESRGAPTNSTIDDARSHGSNLSAFDWNRSSCSACLSLSDSIILWYPHPHRHWHVASSPEQDERRRIVQLQAGIGA